MDHADGGCLCGKVRYAVDSQPQWTTVCHCRFCQRATGAAYMVEPVFQSKNFRLSAGTAKTYDHVSAGSGKMVHIHFCADCGTKLYLSFERFPDAIGVYAGTFDDPNWFERGPASTKHIFLDVAQRGTIVPAGTRTFRQHATDEKGVAVEPTIFGEPKLVE